MVFSGYSSCSEEGISSTCIDYKLSICIHVLLDEEPEVVKKIEKVSELWKYIRDQNNQVKVFSLLITVASLPDCCHDVATALQNAFKIEKLPETCFAQSEFIAPIREKDQSRIGKIDQHSSSFFYSIKSGMKWENVSNDFSIEDKDVDSEETKQALSICQCEQNIRKCFESLTTTSKAQSFTKVSLSQTSKKSKMENLLVQGIGLVNLWEMKLDNKTVRPLIESFGKCFNRSLVWLFLDLDKDLPDIHSPLGGIKGDPKALSWRSRIEYLLRQCHLCKYSMYNERHRVCTIFAIHAVQDEKKLRSKQKELQNECEDAARQMGIDELIDFDIQLVCNEGKQIAETLKKRMKYSFMQVKEISIPVSWPFLRELMNTTDKPWITFAELEKMADDCKLENGKQSLKEFCEFYESFGSLLQVRQVDKQSPYIITKPKDFLGKYNKFLTRIRSDCKDGIIETSEDQFTTKLNSIGIADKK